MFDDEGDVPTFEVTVWDMYGDIVAKRWHATQAEVEVVYDQYEDDPEYSVSVERN